MLLLVTAEEDEEGNTVLGHQCYARLALLVLRLNPCVCGTVPAVGCREPGSEEETEHQSARNVRKVLGNLGVFVC